MRLYIILWLLNIILVIDWAKNKRPLPWLAALCLFGPLGALAYLIYFYESINFPIELAKTVRQLTGKKTLRACPRCGQVKELVSHQDGRQKHFMCQACVERTFMEPHDSSEVLEAANSILKSSDNQS
jgi:ribosomal protein S27AE